MWLCFWYPSSLLLVPFLPASGTLPPCSWYPSSLLLAPFLLDPDILLPCSWYPSSLLLVPFLPAPGMLASLWYPLLLVSTHQCSSYLARSWYPFSWYPPTPVRDIPSTAYDTPFSWYPSTPAPGTIDSSWYPPSGIHPPLLLVPSPAHDTSVSWYPPTHAPSTIDKSLYPLLLVSIHLCSWYLSLPIYLSQTSLNTKLFCETLSFEHNLDKIY